MAGKSTEEEYWNTSSNVSFNFDDNEHDKTFTGSGDVFDIANADSVFGANLEDSNAAVMLPMHSVITKRNLDSVLDDVRIPSETPVPLIQETIVKMFLGMPYVLHVYRSLDQKLELLDEALATEDGNVILSVLLYLTKSLKLSVLLHHLSRRKIALHIYTNYLMQELKLEELADLYMLTGNCSDIVYLFYLGSKDTSNKESLHIKLLRFFAEHQSKLDYESNIMFSEYKNFIKWQIENNLPCNSVVEQLAALYKKESEKKIDNSKEIASFKHAFKVNDFQNEWVQLNALAALGMWKKLIELCIKPNWLTKKNSLKSAVDPQLFISRLHEHNAPKYVLEEFLVCLVDNEISVTLAKKMQCHKFVIDTYITQRDRLAILNYTENIPSKSEEYFYAQNALRLTDKKWKN